MAGTQIIPRHAVAAPHGETAAETYRRIRDLIIRGRIKPGMRVLESALAADLGVSRTPVREALDRLEREGYLRATGPGRRTQLAVAPISEAAIKELWTLVGALEGVAIESVAEMGRDARRQLAARMAEINDALARETARKPMDVDRTTQLMSEFHLAFMDVCAGPHVSSVYHIVRPHVQRYEWAYGARPNADFRISIREHRQILEAVGEGNGSRARILLEKHWRDAVPRTAARLRA